MRIVQIPERLVLKSAQILLIIVEIITFFFKFKCRKGWEFCFKNQEKLKHFENMPLKSCLFQLLA